MRINKYIYASACLALSLGVMTSCDTDKTIEYQPAPAGTSQPSYFLVQPTRSVSLGDSDTETMFTIYRASEEAPAEVTFTWEGDTDMFTLPSGASFEEGDIMTQAIVEVEPQNLDPSKTYSLKVTINGTETTPYTQNYIEFAFRYFPMSEWALFGYNESLGRNGEGIYYFSQYYSGTDYVQVEYRYSLLDENQIEYRFKWIIDPSNPALGFETFLTAASDDGGQSIYVPEQAFDVHPTYGDVYVMTAEMYNPAAKTGESYFDEVTGTFYLDVIYFVDAGYFGYGYETCVLNGYADTNDYSVTLTNIGSTTINDVNYQLIDVKWAEAVDLVGYTVVDTASLMDESGEAIDETLVEDLIKDIVDGKVDATIIPDQGIMNLSFANPGNYTMLAVTFKEGETSYEQKDYSTLSFTYTTTDPNAGWHSLGYVEYTDGYVCTGYLTGIVSYYVELQEADDLPGYYRLVDPYGAYYPYNDPGDWNDKVISYLYFDVEMFPRVPFVDYSPQTLNWGDGELYCYSQAANQLAGGSTPSQVLQAGLAGIWKDDVLTFPAMALMVSFDSGKAWYAANYALDVDYYEQTGTAQPMVDANGNYLAPFMVDLNTATDDPLAVASTAGTRAEVARMYKEMINSAKVNYTPVEYNRAAKVVRYKGEPVKAGRHQPYRSLSATPLR